MMIIIIISWVDGFEKPCETCGLKKKRGKRVVGFVGHGTHGFML